MKPVAKENRLKALLVCELFSFKTRFLQNEISNCILMIDDTTYCESIFKIFPIYISETLQIFYRIYEVIENCHNKRAGTSAQKSTRNILVVPSSKH